ncbi:putative ribonuclease H-like domain-containing protein [Tanacetum coccineum]
MKESETLPKFGDWDLKNPSSATEFSIIFDKARQARKAMYDHRDGNAHWRELGVSASPTCVDLLRWFDPPMCQRISFDEFDDEDYMVIFDNDSFSYKIIYVDNFKTDSENDNDKVDMPSFPSPEPTVSYFNNLDYLKDFENKFPAIVYDDALTSKLDFLTEPTVRPQHIDGFNLKDETSLSKCDEEEQDVLYFNDLFPLNVIYPDDLKSDKDNDDDKI